MMGIYNGLVADALNIVKAPQADLWVVEAGTQGPFAEASSKSRAIPATPWHGCVAWRRRAASPTRPSRPITPGPRCGFTSSAMSRAAPADRRPIAEGRDLSRSHFEMVADAKTGLAVGDTLRLGRDRFTVVGLVRRHDEFGRRSGGVPDAGRCAGAADPACPAGRPGAGGTRRLRSEAPTNVAAVIARLDPGADASAAGRHRAAVEAPFGPDPGRTGKPADPLGGGQGPPADRPVPRHPADRLGGGDRADHLHHDDGEAEADRHAEADRRARPHHRRADRAAVAGAGGGRAGASG